jgi:TetR/AcrR family transcriptional regulator, regulator of autoinduction and epiphytic fitness
VSVRQGTVPAAGGVAGPAAPAEQPAGARVDGRSRRAERTRQAIVDALLSLLEDGHLKTPAARIAERAGVSVRALWTNFKDMETLYAAVNRRLMERQRAEHREIPPELPLPARIAAFCRQRARMLEIITPSARAAHLLQPYSAQLRRNRAVQIELVRSEIETLFGAELAAAGPGRARLHAAVLVATTFNAWQMARDQLGLSVEEAAALMDQTVTALLTAARPG